LGGKIEIESFPNQGTTVKIYLPFVKAESEEMEKGEIQIEAQTEPTLETLKTSKRILLMDDERDLRESLKELLESFGYEVVTCENGEEAVEIYQKEGPFGAVILDLTVPGKWDGLQTFEILKKIDPEVKAILATGYAYKREVLNAEALGFKGVLIKPFTIEDLLKLLENLEKVAS